MKLPQSKMVLPAPPNDAKATARRRRHAADTARWRSRRRREVELYQIEVGAKEKALAVRFAGLKEGTNDKAAIAVALGKLLRLGLVALLHEEGIAAI